MRISLVWVGTLLIFLILLTLSLQPRASQAAPASWYWWHSRLDSDVRVCAQFMPSQGWQRRGPPFNNPRCSARAPLAPQR